MNTADDFLSLEDFETAIKFRETAWLFAQKHIAGLVCSEKADTNGDIIKNTVDGDLIINAAQTITLDGGTVTGKVIVEGGTFTATNGAIIQGGVEGMGGATITIEDGSTVNSDIVVSGSGSSLTMTGLTTTVDGKVETKEISSVSLTDITAKEIVSDKDADVTMSGNTAEKIEIKDPTGSCIDSGQTTPTPDPGC